MLNHELPSLSLVSIGILLHEQATLGKHFEPKCNSKNTNHNFITYQITLIRFGKFEEITVLMAKTCNFDSNISDFNSVDLKKAKK